MLLTGDLELAAIESLLSRFGLLLELQEQAQPITGSFWGECEAGIVGRKVFAREDTPVHSLLHETCHIVCMTPARRDQLNRDAGGDDIEESAVCFLQVVLADYLDGAGSAVIMRDMDEWGYSFRLGSTSQWFRNDAEDAREFLLNHGLLDAKDEPTFKLRLL